MPGQVVIENPVINSPFEKPSRHFRFGDEGMTNEIVKGRRVSAYFVPVPGPRKRAPKQTVLDTGWTENRLQENCFVNGARDRVSSWRLRGRSGITKTSAL